MREEQFWIKGSDSAFIYPGGRRISSMYQVDEDEDSTHLLVQLWDASIGALVSHRLLEVNDVAVTQFSPNGCFLAVERKSKNVIEL